LRRGILEGASADQRSRFELPRHGLHQLEFSGYGPSGATTGVVIGDGTDGEGDRALFWAVVVVPEVGGEFEVAGTGVGCVQHGFVARGEDDDVAVTVAEVFGVEW